MAGSSERARHWRYAELPGVDLLRARYVRKTFVRHTHENFVIAAIADGVEVFHHRGADQYAGAGTLALVNPDTPHTGRAGVPEGWRYGAVYPSPEVVAEIAAETTSLRGTPGFVRPVLDDPYAVGLVHQVLRAADEGNALAADTLLRVAVTRLLRSNGGVLPQRDVRTAGARTAARARAVLEERMAEPPTLERLAADLGTSPFALLRAFRDALRDAAAHLADGCAGATGPAAAGRGGRSGVRRRRGGVHGPAASEPAFHPDRRGAPGGLPARAQERTRLSGQPLLTSEAWQNRQLSQIRTPMTQESRTPPSYGTPSESGSPSDCPVSPSG